MKNFALTHVDCTAARTELHELLHLTGCEASLNNLPAGVSIPFVHAHTKNEELYVILAGNGTFFVDGEEFAVKAGDAIRVDPNGQRCLKAGDTALRYLCIQTKAGSLEGFTMGDAKVADDFAKPTWLK